MALSNQSFRLFIAGETPEPAINPSGALLMGSGTSTVQPEDNTADKNWLQFYLKSSATTGTSRGMYLRLYLSAGAGGEAARIFTTVSNAAPADTVNGAHVSLSFGSSAGNVTGLGTASRNTLHLGNRSMTGTLAAVQAEIYADGSSSDIGGTTSYFRVVNDGNATGVGKIDDKAFLLHLAGFTAGAAHMWVTGLTAATVNAATTAAIKINVGGTTYYIPVATAIA